MRYKHTLVLQVTEISLPGGSEVELLARDGLVVRLTEDPEPYCDEPDRSSAIATGLLHDLFSGGGRKGTFEDRLAAQTATVAAERRERQGSRPFLVLEREGEGPELEAGTRLGENDMFELRLNGSPKDDIGKASRGLVAAILTALGIVTGRNVAGETITESIVFRRPDGKPVYAFTISPSADLEVRSSLGQNASEQVGAWFDALRRDERLQRVVELYRDALAAKRDRLRDFLFGWTALEIMTNNLFGAYERALIEEIRANSQIVVHDSYLDRVTEVMSGKYNIRDKFALIASRLSPAEVDQDLKEFREAKKQRDDLLHGRPVAVEELPVHAVRRLVKKYLELEVGQRIRGQGIGV